MRTNALPPSGLICYSTLDFLAASDRATVHYGTNDVTAKAMASTETGLIRV